MAEYVLCVYCTVVALGAVVLVAVALVDVIMMLLQVRRSVGLFTSPFSSGAVSAAVVLVV